MGNCRVIQVGFSDEEFNARIDEETREEIKKRYSVEEELKLIRKSLKALGINDAEFDEYNRFVEETVAKGKEKKQNASVGKPIVITPNSTK